MQSDEHELRGLIGSLWDDPLSFVLAAFPWGEPGGPLADHSGPDQWQRDCLESISEHIRSGRKVAYRDSTASGHGVGKSSLVAWLILWFVSTRPNAAGVVTANTQAQLKSKTWRELSIWHRRAINSHWFDWSATRFSVKERPESWGIDAIPWSDANPEAFAGLHADDVLVIYDEASAIADAIWEVSEGAMTTPGSMWFAFGNPTRNSGRFHASHHGERHRWVTRAVDARTCKMPNRAELDAWVEEYGVDSDFVRVRVRGLFPRAGSNQWIGQDLIDQAQQREAIASPDTPLVLGVDVARHGDDQSVLLFRRGMAIEHVQRLRIPDTMQVASRVAEAIAERSPHAVFVDASGIGWSVVDRLRQLGHAVIPVQTGERATEADKYYNKRMELWARMREWLREGGALPPQDRELADDLTGPEYGFDNRQRTQLEKKEDMKKRGLASPDAGDALALTFDQLVSSSSVALVDRSPPNWRAA